MTDARSVYAGCAPQGCYIGFYRVGCAGDRAARHPRGCGACGLTRCSGLVFFCSTRKGKFNPCIARNFKINELAEAYGKKRPFGAVFATSEALSENRRNPPLSVSTRSGLWKVCGKSVAGTSHCFRAAALGGEQKISPRQNNHALTFKSGAAKCAL